MKEESFSALRQQMLQEVVAHTVYVRDELNKPALDDRVLAVIGKVPRHEFVPIELKSYAYANVPLPIGYGKTISQPFIVALMTDLLDVQPQDTVLEIGTGLGYQAAILAELAAKVYSMEIVDELAALASKRLTRLGYTNVEMCVNDGYHGWAERAPFDKLMVTAAPDLIPPPLINQLKAGGKMVIPAGLSDSQQLMLVEKDEAGRVSTKEILAVRFTSLEHDDQPQVS